MKKKYIIWDAINYQISERIKTNPGEEENKVEEDEEVKMFEEDPLEDFFEPTNEKELMYDKGFQPDLRASTAEFLKPENNLEYNF